jgi:addiction module RelE/StbE family toxin
MTIKYSKNFSKQFAKLPQKLKSRFIERQRLFVTDRYSPILRMHSLSGKYQGYYSIDITGDYRALFEIEGNTIIIFGFIGSHSQLY